MRGVLLSGVLASSALAARQVVAARQRRTRRAANAAVRAAALDSALASVSPVDEPHVAVAIAAFNEANSVRDVLTAIPDSVCGLPVQVIVVDDGSSDKTARIAADCGAIVARHSRNLGQGDGLRTGFAVALRTGASIVVTMDADGQHNPAEIADLVEPIVADVADYAQGSRFLGRYDDAGTPRHVAIKIFTTLINALAGTDITDCTNGFRAIRASGLERMQLREDRFSASEIIIEACARGLRMREIPVHVRRRAVGESRKPRGLAYPIGYLAVIFRSWGRAKLSWGQRAIEGRAIVSGRRGENGEGGSAAR